MSQADQKSDTSTEDEVADFLRFLPILNYTDEADMMSLDADDVLNMAIGGIGTAMLAGQWKSRRLISIDKANIDKLISNPELLESIKDIEGYRTLHEDVRKIITHNEEIKEAKKAYRGKLNPSDRSKEREADRLYKEIIEKLRKFMTRIPIFMYLTDYREAALEDVIKTLDSKLFEQSTGLKVRDFELLCDAGVFNKRNMDIAIRAFRLKERTSLEYAGATLLDETYGKFFSENNQG